MNFVIVKEDGTPIPAPAFPSIEEAQAHIKKLRNFAEAKTLAGQDKYKDSIIEIDNLEIISWEKFNNAKT